jgi:type IV pilus assembly protein PilM
MRILGMEFGAWSVKAVEMESRFRRVEILDLHEVKLPLQLPNPTEAYKAAVSQLMARLPSHPEKVVTSLPPAQSALRFLQIPLKSRKKVEQSFKFDLEDSIPFKLDDSIIEHHVSSVKDGSLVFAAIAPKKYIHSHLEWLKAIGVEPDWLSFEGMGIINLYLSSQSEKDAGEDSVSGPVLLLDIGHQKTNLSVISEKRLEMFRSLSWGGINITQAIASGMTLSLEEAEQKKIRNLRLDEDSEVPNAEMEDLITASTQAFVPFIADLSHALVAYRSLYQIEVGSILLTGGTAKVQGIDDFISKNLGLPTSFFKPFKNISLGREIDVSQEMSFGEPLGRAFVFTRKSELLFNFRKDDLAKGTSLTEVSTLVKDPNILKLGQYAAVLAGILFAASIFLGYIAEKEARRAREEMRKVFSDTFRSVPSKLKTSLTNDPKELKKYIDLKNNELNQKLKMLSKERTPMMGLLRQISEAFPPEVKVDVNSVIMDDRALRVEGVLYSGDLDRVTDQLKKLPNFNKISVDRDGQRFTYKGEIVGR